MTTAFLPSAPVASGGFTRRILALLGSLLCARSSVSWVEVPEGLAVPPTARARRLMRNARCGGW